MKRPARLSKTMRRYEPGPLVKLPLVMPVQLRLPEEISTVTSARSRAEGSVSSSFLWILVKLILLIDWQNLT